MAFLDRIKSWFSKEEQRMIGYDESHASFTEHQHPTDDPKPHMEERIEHTDD
jgi:hypothetical protein